jgi:hypothetical protein
MFNGSDTFLQVVENQQFILQQPVRVKLLISKHFPTTRQKVSEPLKQKILN